MAYLIFDKNTKLTKIGTSIDAKKRLCVLKTANPNLVLVYSDAKINEKELHCLYKEKRVFREWFKLTLKDYKNIIGDNAPIPKTLYYRSGMPKFIEVRNKVSQLDIDFVLKKYPNYGYGKDKSLYNLKTGNKIKFTLKGLKPGFYINREFVYLDDIQ